MPHDVRDFVRWAREDRRQRLAELGRVEPDPQPTTTAWARIGELVAAYGRRWAEAAWVTWGADPFVRKAGWPLALFACQWERAYTRALHGAEAAPAQPAAPAQKPPDTPAGHTWRSVLEALAASMPYAARALAAPSSVQLLPGPFGADLLVSWPDAFKRDWLEQHYLEHVNFTLEGLQLPAARIIFATEADAAVHG